MEIAEAIQDIMYHIGVLNDDYTRLSIDVAVLKNQMSEVLWLVKTTVGALIVLMVSQAWQIFKIKRDK